MTRFKTGDKVVLASDHMRHGRVVAVSGSGKKVFVRWWNREVGQYSPRSLLLREVARAIDEADELTERGRRDPEEAWR